MECGVDKLLERLKRLDESKLMVVLAFAIGIIAVLIRLGGRCDSFRLGLSTYVL